jgi:glutathione S-transferase
MKLVIGNKNYSSWSLRPWIAMAQAGIAFDEVVVPLAQPDTKAALAAHSPTGLVPVLIDGDLVIPETIAILEYLNDRFPEARLWPADIRDRARARAFSAEMHAGFQALRRDCPMNIRRPVQAHEPSPQGLRDAARIDAIWRECRNRAGGEGPFLFGAFCAADAMFAPVVNRFHVYDVPRSDVAQAYMDAIMALPAWKLWEAAARAEPWTIANSEVP